MLFRNLQIAQRHLEIARNIGLVIESRRKDMDDD